MSRRQSYVGGAASAPPPPPPPPPQAGGDRRGVPPWVYWLIGALVIGLVVAIVLLVVGGGDKSATSSSTTSSTTLGPGETPGEVFLEAARVQGPDSFTEANLESAVVSTTAPVVSTTTSTTQGPTTTLPAGTVALTSMSGGQPGLYGGTQNQTRCDKAAMLAYLLANQDKANAWVIAQNSDPTLRWDDGRTSLTVADLPAFFDELTPVTLIYDTRVTNHGYRNGLPTPRQSVLQAGTAVLVDSYGVPRARCACGNPLIPPIASPTPPTWVGPQWPGFTTTVIIVVIPAPTVITQVIIIDLNTGGLIDRPVGTTGGGDSSGTTGTTTTLTLPPDIIVGTGDVQVTLLWNTDSDMDLHVIDPDGFEIYFGDSTSPSGGQLDVDDIPSQGDTSTHVENIFWPTGGAPAGTYQAFVHHYSSQTGGPSTYTMEVRVGGQLIHQESGTLAEDATSTPFEFQVG
jgi:hypothetical protein